MLFSELVQALLLTCLLPQQIVPAGQPMVAADICIIRVVHQYHFVIVLQSLLVLPPSVRSLTFLEVHTRASQINSR